ncbi:hypothetical protein [uncultured Ruegeria sp.]|uniref:hypothetical protein n=1 Tax=uncultured Ruegeria sp. TaxID=259304 RepID=UPI00260B21CC|nr:hypothetical protein [uncultured Ruegeria sp.]
MMIKRLSALLTLTIIQPVSAEEVLVSGLPPFTEAILPFEADVYAISIGPGGPGEEFGSQATNGGLYKLGPNGVHESITLSDGEGLRNPTGLVELGDQIVLVDGNQVISLSPEGDVNWRRSYDEEGVFFYDVEVLNGATLLVSDFGRGGFVSVSANTGDIQPTLNDVQIDGLARFEITDDQIYAVSWGTDDAWDSAVYRISGLGEAGLSEKLAGGFGNLESVEVVEGTVVVGGYRGHQDHQAFKLMQLDTEGRVNSLDAGSNTHGVSDIYSDGYSIWLNFFYDGAYAKIPAKHVLPSS